MRLISLTIFIVSSVIIARAGTITIKTKPILRGIWQGNERFFIDKISGKLATEFTVHSLKLARHKVVMLSKITYLEGIRRKKLIFDQKKLQTVFIFTKRVAFKKPGSDSLAGGLMAFGWFVYDVNFSGQPTIEWI